MKIRFKTGDGLGCVKDCPQVEMPFSCVMSPLWKKGPAYRGTFTLEPPYFGEYRQYEFHGEIDQDGIPTIYEV